MWGTGPLLGSDRKINNETFAARQQISIRRKRLGKYVPAATDTDATIEELLETVFPMWSVPRGNKRKSYKIMRMNMFAVGVKAKPDIENIGGLNLAVVKLTTVQVTKLPL
jgi:hypothetical protein